MVGATVATQSRSGTVGLIAMGGLLAVKLVRRRPGLVFAGAVAMAMSLPMLPESYLQRVSSITNPSLDDTGSREARRTLMREAYQAFLDHPFTGVGAGQFKNYNPEGRQEAWRESHNVLLQVAAELGIFGISVFLFLIGRALYAPIQTRRLLRAAAPGRRPDDRADRVPPLARNEYDAISMHSAALTASIVGWLVCALFASVAYHWTFYYLLALAAAPREYLLARVRARRVARRAAAASPVAAFGISA
jgi:O-antigen ligase